MDRAGLLSAGMRARLERELAEYEAKAGHQIVVHTTPSLEGLEIEDYSMTVAEEWRVGYAGLDNGVILTVAPNERKTRIEVGYGLEGVIPDAIANRIVEDTMIPEFRAGDFEAGILLGTRAVLRAARGEYAPPRPRARGRDGRSRGSPLWSLLWIVLLFMVFGSRGIFFLPFLLGGGGRSGGFGGGGFGGGGGGFGGGGGGFGGGGASGSW